MKRLRDSYTTGIMNEVVWTQQGMRVDPKSPYVRLIINRIDRKKFKVGDQVRVTVTLLKRPRQAKGEGK